jgi:transposase InsO family protein
LILIIVDLGSRKILGWEIIQSSNFTDDILIKLLRETFDKFGKPLFFHSDSGGGFVSNKTRNFLANEGVQQSVYNSQKTSFGNQLVESLNNVLWETLNAHKSNPSGVHDFIKQPFSDRVHLLNKSIEIMNKKTASMPSTKKK